MRAVVTGGGGFLGSVIARQLLARGDTVCCYQRGAHGELEKLGAEVVRGDLADVAALRRVLRGANVCFHVAAKAGVWGRHEDYVAVNVTGTENVIEAGRFSGVGRLVFTSSPSVVFAGRDEAGITEAAAYPRRYLAAYPETKAIAERAVLEANGKGMATVALRPHLIWGPGDPHLVPRILGRARAGRLRLVKAKGKLVDSTYVDNAAAAHLLAADRLGVGAACAGRAYFISNGEPLAMEELVKRILRAANLQTVVPMVPASVAYGLGAMLEMMHKVMGFRAEPMLTRFVARQMACAHWYDLTAARRDLGYAPGVTIDEGMRRLAESLGSGIAIGGGA